MAKRLYEQCCRLCLFSGTEVGLVDVFSIPKLNSLVLDLYNIEITPNDGSTTRVCSVCLKDTLDFNAQIKQYDRDRTLVLEVNAKIRQKVLAAMPTTSAVSKVTKDLATKENRPSNESIQTANKKTASLNATNSNEAPDVAQHKQQVTTENPREIPSKSSDSRTPSAENRASGSRDSSNDKATKGSNAKDKDKDGSRRPPHTSSEQSTAKSKNSAKDLERRSIDKPGSARSENRSPGFGHSGENRASTSGESSNKSKDLLNRSIEIREPSKSKNTDSTRSECSKGKTLESGSSKPSDKPPDKKLSSTNKDYSKSKDNNPSNRKINVTQPLKQSSLPVNLWAKESTAAKNSSTNQSQSNITIRVSDNPRDTEHTTMSHSNNAIVRTYGRTSKNKKDMALEKSDRREAAAEPITSGAKVRFAEGTRDMPRIEIQNLDSNPPNRKRGPDEPLRLPRIKIRLINRAEAPQLLINSTSSNNATTVDLTPTSVSVTTTNPRICTAETTTTEVTTPAVQSRVAELQASKPGIPKRRHSVYNTSLIRVSSNLFDSSKECNEFAAIRNNTMLRLDALRNTVANNVPARPVEQGFSQLPSNVGSDRSSAVAAGVPNGSAGTSSSHQQQQQTTVTDANILPRAVQKTAMQRRKSVCVANVRQINEQFAQSNTNYQTRIYPTSATGTDFPGGLYISSNNVMHGQSIVQNPVPVMRTSDNYVASSISSGNTTISPLALNVPNSSAAPVPTLRLTLGNNTIPVHIVNRIPPASTAGGVVRYPIISTSNTNAAGGSVPRPSMARENHHNQPRFVPIAPRPTSQPQRPQMPTFEHSYSVN
ncbi:mucin-4-like isoform X2 [Anopheles albimanus]|uniref:mucin-4-like isoform X2 n=1 Tax=Anopheles albimanus TaxID=7167 RepID=UPI001641F3D4|nr:mucin-4-like isoform X2 [Anopheles albimanus]